MRTAYLDCFSGISGDMTLGALVDAGAELSAIADDVGRLDLPGWDLKTDPDARDPRIGGTSVIVDCAETGHVHRTFADIRGMIEAADLPERVRAESIAVFRTLAVAEGTVHGKDPEEVGFHEVGAVDSIVDIVGSVAGLHRLGIERVVCSPLPLGHGTVRCQHGVIPVPAPATVELLLGCPTYDGGQARELVTPTGAALARTLSTGFGRMPEMVLRTVGHGLGKARGEGLPNALRLLIGDAEDRGSGGVPQERAVVLEANIDDMSPQFVGPLIDRLLEAGAMDAFLVPIQMKKGRPGVLVSAICAPHEAAPLEAVLFEQTTTIGVRRSHVHRSCLERRWFPVETPWGSVRIKESGVGDRVLNRMPEFEDCHDLATKAGVSPLEVHLAALAALPPEGESGP